MGLRYAVAVALIALGSAVPRAEPERPQTHGALAAARAYLSSWQNTLTSLVVEEEYRQRFRRGLGNRRPPAVRRRRLRSELLLLRAPAENVWLSFRDVFEVDGNAVGDRQKRFDALFSTPAAMLMATAERIGEESGRFNLGRPRTINTPTAGLVFLHPQYEVNTKWEVEPGERLDDRPVWRLRFDQRKPPYGVKIPGLTGYSSTGSFWLEPDTGAIVKWELRVRAGISSFRVTTTYGRVPAISEGRVPLAMEEEYETPPFEQLDGRATYSKHRLFRTAGRIISPPD